MASLGPSVTGAWVLGSLADGTYRAGVSDIDLLVVGTCEKVDVPDDVDLAVLTAEEAARGGDGVNALRVLAARATSISLLGGPAAGALGAPPERVVLAAVADHLDGVLDHELTRERWPSGVLAACRDLAGLLTPMGTVIGKEEAGAWALERLPAEHRPLVAAALAARLDPAPTEDSFDAEALRRFRQFVTGAAVRRRPGRKVAGLP